MGIVLPSSFPRRKIESVRGRTTFYREQIADMTDAEAKEYLLDVVELAHTDATERLGRIKDEVPHADKQGVQILGILWSARPRIKTYGYIGQHLEQLNGRYPDQLAITSAVKRLRRALEKTDFPIEIRNHSGLGYNLHAPADWKAPWDDE